MFYRSRSFDFGGFSRISDTNLGWKFLSMSRVAMKSAGKIK
jgi:hypothetical protein